MPEFLPEFASPADYAAMYRRLGLSVLPGRRGEKRPLIDWKAHQDGLPSQAVFDGWFDPVRGEHRASPQMGLATGEVFVVDLDRHKVDGLVWWRTFVVVYLNGIEPQTWVTRTGGGGLHIYFRAPPGWRAPTFKRPDLGVDGRGVGGWVVIPPSVHPNGTEYVWLEDHEPWACELATAPAELCAALDALAGPQSEAGAPRERTASTGEAVNSFGLTVDGREEKMLRAVWGAVVDLRRESAERPSPERAQAEFERVWGRYALTTKSRLEPRPGADDVGLLEVEGRGRTAMAAKWAYAMAQWETKVAEAAGHPKPHDGGSAATPARLAAWDDEESAGPNPALGWAEDAQDAAHALDPWSRPRAAMFPLDSLPATARGAVEMQSRWLGADPSAVAMAALGACSGALDHRMGLKMMRTASWQARPRLWVLLAGEPSVMKSPVINAMARPLLRIEADLRAARAKAMKQHEARKKKGEEEPEPPPYRRLVVDDTTPEALARILAGQDCGVLTLQQEVSGWLGQMERYNSGGARSAWLRAYDGGTYTMDRVKHGELHASNYSISFLGGMQPELLGRLKADLSGDGLLQRFLPVMMRPPREPEEAADEGGAVAAYEAMIEALANAYPTELTFSDAGQAVADGLRKRLFKLRTSPGLSGGFVSFLGKLDGVYGALCILLHMMANPVMPGREVREETALAAARIVEAFIVPHGRLLHEHAMLNPEIERLRQIGDQILLSEQDRFTPSFFTRKVYALEAANVQQVQQALSPLEAGGWLTQEVGRGGKPAWVLNPAVRGKFADRRAALLAAKIGGGDE